jgi:hypothetical protein
VKYRIRSDSAIFRRKGVKAFTLLLCEDAPRHSILHPQAFHSRFPVPLGWQAVAPDNLTRSGEWSETGKGKNGEDVPIKGYWSEIDTRQGDAWKVCVLTGNLTPDSWALIYKSFGLPPAATPSPTASPSNQ